MNTTIDFNFTSSIYNKSSNNLKKLSEKELSKEVIEDLPKVVIQKTGGKKEELIQVAFRDTNDPNKIVTLNLNKESLEKLLQHFKEEDFKIRDDGTIRITGKAESFISGWYDDVVDNRGSDLVGADLQLEYNYLEGKLKSSQGEIETQYYSYSKMATLAQKIDKDALLEGLTAEQKKRVEPLVDLANLSVDYYQKMLSLFSEEGTSIEKRLENSLLNDKNFDGRIDFSEQFRNSILKDTTSQEDLLNGIIAKHFKSFNELGLQDVSFEKFKAGGGLKEYTPQNIELKGLTNADDDNRIQLMNFQNKEQLINLIEEAKNVNAADALKQREQDQKTIISERDIKKLENEVHKNAKLTLDLLDKTLKTTEDGEKKEKIYKTINGSLNSVSEEKYNNFGDYLLTEKPTKKETIYKLQEISSHIETSQHKREKEKATFTIEEDYLDSAIETDKKTIETISLWIGKISNTQYSN